MKIRNPRTGQFDYEINSLTNKELYDISINLRQNQTTWRESGVSYRIAILQQWKNALQERSEAIVEALCQDTGRRSESILEMNLLLSSIDRCCGIATDFFAQSEEKQSAVPFIRIRQEFVPYSLVGVISPWNFPLLLSIIDTIPALLSGCAVMVKPSEITPRFIAPMLDSIAAVPVLADIFTYITGDGQTGANLLQHIDLVCFTGSVATGKKVYASMAAQLKPCFLELGGKDAALIFEGADLDLAASAILWGSCVNCGHSCLSIERVYVEQSIFDAFLAKLTAKAESVALSYPTYDDGQIGPVISESQAIIINAHLEDALAKGAIIAHGKSQCEVKDGGIWCTPTILTNVNHDMKIMTEETFGPIIPLMPFYDEAEAVALANSTIFGLSGAVFSESVEKSAAIAMKMDAGAISLNDCALTAIIHEGEKNAFRQSGIGGTRMGNAAIKRFMRQKVLLMKMQAIPSPWWW